MKVAGTFSGIGGFELGFARAGIQHTAMCEIIAARQKVLARNFDLPIGGDIREVHGRDLGTPDIVCGGFPCKDLSIGKANRKGLTGDDSGLFWEFHRLVAEHLRLVDETGARWLVLENTPGLVGYNRGHDLDTVCHEVEKLGYGWAYRVVDARSFGSAQKRPRWVFVAHRGGDPRPAAQVLGLTGPSAEADPAYRIGSEPGESRRASADDAAPGVHIWRKSARPRAKLSEGGYETWVPAEFANTLTGFDAGNAARQTHLLTQAGRLRTFTPIEWERLSGFPDDWTAGMPHDERLRALGDCFHIDTAEWLGRRLKHIHETIPMIQEAA